MFINKKRIVADDELDIDIDEQIDDMPADDDAGVDVDPEAAELLFETEDVAELIAEVAGVPVEVTVEDGGDVKFAVGEDEFTVTPEGDEEFVESSTRIARKKRAIRASSTRGTARRPRASRNVRRPVKASTAPRRAVRPAKRATRR